MTKYIVKIKTSAYKDWSIASKRTGNPLFFNKKESAVDYCLRKSKKYVNWKFEIVDYNGAFVK
jgi:hypothetical protein